MDTAYFKACVNKTLELKPAKEGLRWLARKAPNTYAAQGIVGLKTSVGALMFVLEDYTLGATQLTPELREAAADWLGECLYHATALARVLKVSVPGSGKKVKLHGMTYGKALFELDAATTRMLIEFRKVFSAGSLDTPKLAEHLKQVFELLWPLATDLAHKLPADLMAAQVGKLSATYPEGFFEQAKKSRKPKEPTAEGAGEPAPAESSPA